MVMIMIMTMTMTMTMTFTITFQEFAQKFFKSPETPDSSGDEIKKLEIEFKQSIQELKDLMEEKEKKIQATLEDLVNK